MDTPPPPFPEFERKNIVHRLSRLVDVSVTLNSTLDLAQLLSFILETAAELLDCEAASILLYDEKREGLFFTAATGSDQARLAEIPVPIEGSIAGTVFKENRPLVVNNVGMDPRHYNVVGEQISFQPRSLLAVPMVIQDRATGVLEALNKNNGEFSEEDVWLLSVIASQAAVAIHNARLVHALQSANQELSRIDKVKSDFISIASHELRTPLGIILGYATFLKEDARGELSEHAGIVFDAALGLQSLVEAMTNLDLLQKGLADLDRKPLIMQEILMGACKEQRPSAEGRGQTLHLDLPGEPLWVLADSEKMGLVFNNLLNNAIRFSPPGAMVLLMTRRVGKDVRVQIQDTGAGIRKSELENIFKEFYQAADHMTRKHGGLGLGLSIARGLVNLHGGKIWAESDGPGQGSTFNVVLSEYTPAD